MAIAVKTPNNVVGKKLDKIKMQNPDAIVVAV